MCDLKLYQVTLRERNYTIHYIILKILQSDFRELADRKSSRRMKNDWSIFCHSFYFPLFCVLFFFLFGLLGLFSGWVSFGVVFHFHSISRTSNTTGPCFYEIFIVVRLTDNPELFLNWTELDLLNSPYHRAWSGTTISWFHRQSYFKTWTALSLFPTFSKVRL